MRVILVNRASTYTQPGGDTVQFENTYKYLLKLGVTVDKAIGIEDLNKKLSKYRYDIVHIFNIQTFHESLLFLRLAKAKNKKVVLSPIFWDLSASVVANILTKMKLPLYIGKVLPKTIIYNLYLWLKKKGYKEAIKELIEFSDMILPNSWEELKIISNFSGINFKILKAKSIKVPNATFDDSEQCDNLFDIDDKTRELENLITSLKKQGYKVIAEVARISPEKNQDSLIKALFDYKDISILLVGPYSNEKYALLVNKLARKRGNVFLTGPVNQNLLKTIYQNIDAHVLPSFRESPGLSSLEAGKFGIPIVVSKYAPVKEYFGENAIACDPFSLKSIKQSVLKALWNFKGTESLAKQVSKFRWDLAAKVTLEAYKIVLNLNNSTNILYHQE
ncbi:MAG: hypothetical protein PWQ72_2022 [Pseudothermotoga sp.]|nr:hypothetical protein [Pseudothermotoga sp.]